MRLRDPRTGEVMSPERAVTRMCAQCESCWECPLDELADNSPAFCYELFWMRPELTAWILGLEILPEPEAA